MELIRLEQISKTYRAGEVSVPVLKDVSLTIREGELVALMGASGSGKTTLMNILGCLDRPTVGRYWLDGEEVSALTPAERANLRSRKIGFVFQTFNLLPRTNSLDNVTMPLVYARGRPSDGRERARTLIESVSLAGRLDRVPAQLSGGEQQRVAIARALVNRPVLLLADEPTGNLDSRTSADILRLFQELNAGGLTILLVTHDPEVATHAQRVIRIRDGRIECGEVPISRAAASAPSALPTPTLPKLLPERQAAAVGVSAMRNFRPSIPGTWHTAVRALRRNAVRSSLTALGIIIGIAAVIAMMEIGHGSQKAVEQSISSMGANTVLVFPGAAATSGVTFGVGTVQTLTPDDADEIARHCTGIRAVAPLAYARAQIVYGNRNWVPVIIQGTTPDYLAVRDWEALKEGVAFTDRDVRNGSQVCLVGQTIVRELFQGRSPLGKEIRIQNAAFKVVGVLSRKGANMLGMDQDDTVLAPWTTIKYRVSGTTLTNVNQSTASAQDLTQRVNTLNRRYPGAPVLYPMPSPTEAVDTPQPVRFSTVDRIILKTTSAREIPRTIPQIIEVLRERHHIHPGQEDDFTVRDMTEITRTLASATQLIGGLLLAVALISLVVGGVGIMNIMLVSVTERTREIGLRMAVGAAPHMILRQFLIEAVVLCLLGGALGVVLGRSCSFAVRELLHWPTEISLSAIVAAVGVSVTVGLVFGFYPAWKASRLDPIEALRYE
jgi:macrolide transport system ATP-binding/permease protein